MTVAVVPPTPSRQPSAVTRPESCVGYIHLHGVCSLRFLRLARCVRVRVPSGVRVLLSRRVLCVVCVHVSAFRPEKGHLVSFGRQLNVPGKFTGNKPSPVLKQFFFPIT